MTEQLPTQTASGFYFRGIMALVLVSLAGGLAYVLFLTPLGEQLRNRTVVHAWVAAHRAITPLVLVSLYVLFATTMLPVWWIQIAAGYCFGLWWGLLWCEIGAVISAVLSLHISRWLLADWFRRRYESQIVRLRQINETLGNNGLLVVMTTRLTHVMPFGLSNALFGLTRIGTLDVAVGTLLGGCIGVSLYVALGVGGHVLRDWRYWAVASTLNVILLVPLFLRYLFPDWFKRIGVK